MKKCFFKLLFCVICVILSFSNVYAFSFDLSSENIILYNLNDNSIVFEKDSEEKIYIASLTKIMTVILAIENIENIDEYITMTKDIYKSIPSNASITDLKIGDVVTYRDLLYGAMLPSGADAVIALAIKVSGSEKEFVNLMNVKAQELKMLNTNFENATGLDSNNHYSSLHDVVILLQYSLQNELFKEIFNTKEYTTTSGLEMKSTVKYASDLYSLKTDIISGSKTGTTKKAGLCLASTTSNGDANLILITAGAPYVYTKRVSHIKDALNIYNYYFDNYSTQLVINEGDLITTIDTIYANRKKVNVYANKDVFKFLPNNIDKKDITFEYEGIEQISYKTKKGEKLGTYSVKYKDEIIYSEEVFLENILFFNIFNYFKVNPAIFVIVCFNVFLVLLIIRKAVNRKHRKRKRH